MSVRPPRQFSNDVTDPLTAALDYEILQEKAGTLARLGRTLEAALARLRAFEADAENPAQNGHRQAGNAPVGNDPTIHHELKREAAQALWYVVIQREICGLPTNRGFFEQYEIPAEIRALMGSRAVIGTASKP